VFFRLQIILTRIIIVIVESGKLYETEHSKVSMKAGQNLKPAPGTAQTGAQKNFSNVRGANP